MTWTQVDTGQYAGVTAVTLPAIDPTQAPYNADPTGTTEATSAFLAAFAAASATIGGATYMREVRVPRGVFLVNGLLFSNVTTNRAPLSMSGAGAEATVFKLVDGANGPALDFGGTASPSLVLGIYRDFSVHGNSANQTVAAPAMRIRNADRCVFENVYVSDSKGDGIYISNSSVVLRDCEGISNAAYGLNVEDSTSVVVDGGYYNNNTLQGIRGKYTGAAGILNGQDEYGLKIRAAHLEQNTPGDVLLDTVDNVAITDCEVNATVGTGFTNGVIHITGPSRNCRILGNTIMQRNAFAQNDTGGVLEPFNWLVLDSLTKDCIYDVPKYVATSTVGGVVITDFMNPGIVDSGRNYAVSPSGPQADGYHKARSENLLTYSEDLTNAAWVRTSIDGTTAQVTSYGNPYDPAGTASQIVPSAASLGYIQQAKAGLTYVAGDLVTFSVWLYAAAEVDVRLEIRDSANALLSREFARLDSVWRRYKVSYVCTGATAELRCRLVKHASGLAGAFYAWGAQLNQGDAGVYVPTSSAARSVTARHMTRLADLTAYANNAAAVAGGLLPGEFYMVTGSDPRQVAVVV